MQAPRVFGSKSIQIIGRTKPKKRKSSLFAPPEDELDPEEEEARRIKFNQGVKKLKVLFDKNKRSEKRIWNKNLSINYRKTFLRIVLIDIVKVRCRSRNLWIHR
eukprot:UN02740